MTIYRPRTMRTMLLVILSNSALAFAAGDPNAETKRPQELGSIAWNRSFDEATAEAKRVGKPILILFQEVPGCATCKNYGRDVLSHPLIRDAAETLFVPTAIYNNAKGDDERTLKSFDEPAWNNPVVRIVSADRSMLAERVAGDYSPAGLVAAMVTALEKQRRVVPPYLRLLHEELSARKRGMERATFAMHCFWEGEAQLGGLNGVIQTRPGFVRGREVVDVWFDPSRISYATLLGEARTMQCATSVFTRTDAQQAEAAKAVGDASLRTDDATRPDKEPKYFLSKSSLRFVPMTETQASRVNAALRSKGDVTTFLSPSQKRIWSAVQAKPEAGWRDAIGTDNFIAAFEAAEATARRVNPS